MNTVTASFNTTETNDRNVPVTNLSQQKMAKMSEQKKNSHRYTSLHHHSCMEIYQHKQKNYSCSNPEVIWCCKMHFLMCMWHVY